MEADTIKQETLSSITSEFEYEDPSTSVLLDDDLKNHHVKIPLANSWKEEPNRELLDEDIKMASVKQEIFEETKIFPGIKMEEIMIKSETENSDNSETDQITAKAKEEIDKYDLNNSQHDVKTISKSKEYTCAECDFITHYRFSLQRHIVSVHKERRSLKKYACLLCNYEALEKRYLDNHVIARHGEAQQKRHVCNRCTFRTNYKRSLQGHVRAVHGPGTAKKHICSFCDYRTVSKFRLEAHILVQHDKGGNKPFET